MSIVEGLIYKIKCMGIKVDLLQQTETFLSEENQEVVLNGQTPEWTTVKLGVSQGLILSPLAFPDISQ